ncbi:hypothetical protein [Sulfurihydrogenibium azorense]|jgi:hypothetical protein|uniref:hypothetical protein n=1 Tax=Sulfurihydrogenibium azorense TaxID=309806 RepID=UPI0024095B9E|nr:hypothetical protein [Sulfurihydrogenibium azorense]MDM7273606.1 hypothetical protein [Sulfurihydrogenibium azorense]
MKVLSLTSNRVRLEFENILEKRQFNDNVKNLQGILNIKETTNTLTINYEQKSQFDYFLRNFIVPSTQLKKEVITLDKDDLHYYIAPLIKSNVLKALWSVSLLGFKRGFLMFTICTLGVGAYLKNEF